MPKKKYPQRDAERCPSHPGALLREMVFPALNMSKTAIAAALGISRNQLHLILIEKQPVTPQTAVKLQAALGRDAQLWIDMQADYDLWHARRTVDVSNVPKLGEAA